MRESIAPRTFSEQCRSVRAAGCAPVENAPSGIVRVGLARAQPRGAGGRDRPGHGHRWRHHRRRRRADSAARHRRTRAPTDLHRLRPVVGLRPHLGGVVAGTPTRSTGRASATLAIDINGCSRSAMSAAKALTSSWCARAGRSPSGATRPTTCRSRLSQARRRRDLARRVHAALGVACRTPLTLFAATAAGNARWMDGPTRTRRRPTSSCTRMCRVPADRPPTWKSTSCPRGLSGDRRHAVRERATNFQTNLAAAPAILANARLASCSLLLGSLPGRAGPPFSAGLFRNKPVSAPAKAVWLPIMLPMAKRCGS